MEKYYFAYHIVNGDKFPFRWSEVDGVACGGDFRSTAVQMREISSHEYNHERLVTVVAKYPYREEEAKEA